MRVMVVDDDSTILAICKGLLEREYEVDLMKSGLQALGFLMEPENRMPDLVLLDMIMPGTGGLETLEAIRKNTALASIPVILMSGQGDDRAELKGYNSGANDFIRKPILPDLLKFKIQRQLELAALQGENTALKRKICRIQMMVSRICSENT